MDLQISIFLLFVIFTAGHSLSCYECTGLTGSCADQKLKRCPGGSSKCLSLTAVSQGQISVKVKTKDCDVDCHSGSMNFGISKVSSSCCNTDQCNVHDAPDPPNTPNGKKCFYCDDKSCSNTVNCSWTEDRCITATGAIGDQVLVVKGCASKSICDATSFIPNVEGISCCEGNLCNGSQSVTQSVLFLCFSLLSYFLMH
ncbi:phospholipase A2 inhibitor 25 kDa subunit-like [Pimephales promelas]|uniref:phospholipase A2 inhibitor 25 kDa subunit-like n=1 Tax=Pimephales promelas TaxID=90988 RepID=UPI001955682B|nr:phospholipase A2 inhibitor 25 kDa subunit-like [Pimephales promelas]